MTYTVETYSLFAIIVAASVVGCGDSDEGPAMDSSTNDAASSDAAIDAKTVDANADAHVADATMDSSVADARADAVMDSNVTDADSTPVFVTADVDGTTQEATAGFEASPAGGGKLQFTGWTQGAPGSDTWTLQVPNAVGNYTCSDAAESPFIQWATVSPLKFYDSNRDNTSCSMEVTAAATAAGEFIVGTFSGTLENISVGGETLTLTNGEFRVRRAN